MIVCCWVPPSDHEEKVYVLVADGLVARLDRVVEADQRVVDELPGVGDPVDVHGQPGGSVSKVRLTFCG